MTSARPFDLATAPLAGTHLIEASAGTGKTYALAGLVLRLVIERRLPVDRILVVTFTVAAAEELRGRIRRRLVEGLAAFEAEDAGDDPLLGRLLGRCPDRDRVRDDLALALAEFDRAPVHTIHGFCQRVLQDHGFEGAAPLDPRVVPDPEDVVMEAVRDVWRRWALAAPPIVAADLAAAGIGPSALRRTLRPLLAHPALELRPPISQADLEALAQRAEDAREALARAWARGGGELRRLLEASPGLNRRKKEFRAETLGAACDTLDRGLRSGALGEEFFGALAALSPGRLAEGTRPGEDPPDHPVLGAVDDLLGALRRFRRAFVPGALASALQTLDREKVRNDLLFFSDLLTRVHAALAGPAGDRLVAALRDRYAAALIDEFQDTDPLQYEIFSRVFGGGTLYLIGDPKQAIYGFRGADVFAYLRAAREAENVHTLPYNWRSEPDLVRAVGRVFGVDRPFVLPDIGFPAVEPSPSEKDRLLVDGWAEPPLRVWFVRREGRSGRGGQINKGWAEEHLPRAVAAEVARLLRLGAAGRATIGGRPLGAGDLAVLVRTNAQAERVQEALRRIGVPGVLYTAKGLFETREAREALTVVSALAEPGNEGLVRAALALDWFGFDAAGLHAVLEDPAAWTGWLERFREWHGTWRDQGFLSAYRDLLSRTRVREHLLRFADGERRVANVVHLGEVLDAAARAGRSGPAGLVRWLEARVAGRSEGDEAYELRLESDERAVRILTVHRSKGLEFPVVLVPFAPLPGRDPAGKAAADGLAYHADDGTMVLTFDPDEIAAHQARARAEGLSEDLRLFYVALTRARNRCVFTWGGFRDAGRSPPGYLFLGPVQGGDPAGTLVALGKSAEDRELRAALSRIEGPGVEVAEPSFEDPGRLEPTEAEPEALQARTFRGRMRTDWRVTSFTALAAGVDAEGADHDLGEPAEEPEGPADEFLGFPRGARTGLCLHEILEWWDEAGTTPSERRAFAARVLRAHGFGPEWAPTVARVLERVAAWDIDGVVLGEVPRRARLHEVEFTFPLRAGRPTALTARELAAALEAPELAGRMGPALGTALGRLSFSPVRGYLRGVMDLVVRVGDRYHLVDWKTNYLGPRPEDYGPEALAAAMARDLYVLQYHLYAVALHLHLRARLPAYDFDRHFGGVHYVFLRGLDPSRPGQGVFTDRPSRERLERLMNCLGPNEGR
ncbi:exodeoxyribonuclease V subunit beta [Deferrisoma camini]|uniref:exodeoxyribonuclease V subunit beta n=1 Tax=Deferrisoma camini TaxID=1035120 RepID=UPI00046CDA3F|nr:exodeoxyribonuclease V subunit beta [Deferrisoma camini]